MANPDRLVPMLTKRNDDGFTLLELLIVIVIIGVLAAIAIPVFMQQRSHAYQAAMTTDLRNAVTAESAWGVEHTGYTTDVTDLTTEGYRATTGVTPVHVELVSSSFVACVKHSSVSTWLVYNGMTGTTTTSASDCS